MRTPDHYFEAMYAASLDPWGYETRWYERRKYDLTAGALPLERYRRGFEPGCSNGVLTAMLARRCDELVAMDPIPRIVAKARDRNPGVTITCGHIPEDWPPGAFDLVVLSEVLYYLTEADVRAVCDRIAAAHVIAVHWRGTTNYPLTGDRVHELLDEQPTWRRLVDHREREFRLAVYEVP